MTAGTNIVYQFHSSGGAPPVQARWCVFINAPLSEVTLSTEVTEARRLAFQKRNCCWPNMQIGLRGIREAMKQTFFLFFFLVCYWAVSIMLKCKCLNGKVQINTSHHLITIMLFQILTMFLLIFIQRHWD